jgi:hypothetical protein
MIQLKDGNFASRFTGFAGAAMAALAVGTVVSPAQADVMVQFGGDANRISDNDTDWQNQIGADQIIQWNGVNSEGGSFGSAGTLVNGNSLNSLGPENLVLTSVSVGSNTTESGFPELNAGGSPNLLGVKSGTNEDGLKFSAADELQESWTFEFNLPVRLHGMIGAAMNFGGERFGIDVEGEGNVVDWSNPGGSNDGVLVGPAGSSVAAATFAPTSNRYVLTLPSDANAIEVPAGDDITISSLQGNVALQGLVAEVVPEPTSLALLGVGGLLAAGRHQRRRG